MKDRAILLVSVCALVVLSAPPAGAAGGDFDTTFGTGGVVTHDFGIPAGDADHATALAIQSNGAIVTVGAAYVSPRFEVVVARYTTGGSLDTTFGGGKGYVYLNLGSRDAEAEAVAIQPQDGAIDVGGFIDNGGTYDFLLVRLTSSGAFDTSLNGTGEVTTSLSSGNDEAIGLALGQRGTMYLAGEANAGPSGDVAVVKYRATGKLATSFGGTGIVTTDLSGHEDGADGIVSESNGDVVIGGFAGTATGSHFAVARYLPTGVLDPSFSGDGVATTDFGYGNSSGNGIAIDGQARIVVAGDALVGSRYRVAAARFLSNGSLDSSFSGDGRATASFPGDSYGWTMGLHAGKLVVAGASYGAAPFPAVIARFDSSGALDTTFSGDGKLVADLTPGDSSVIFGLAFQPADGKIVVDGTGNGNPGLTDQAVARFLGS